jgi:hypothetical protein
VNGQIEFLLSDAVKKAGRSREKRVAGEETKDNES